MTSYYALSIALFCRLIYSIDCSVLLFFFTVYFFFQAEDGIRYSSVTGVQTCVFFFQAEDGIRDSSVTGVQTCAPDLQEKLGEALGLTFQQVQKYEKGTNRVGASRLQQISEILQVPVSFLFDGGPSGGAGADGFSEGDRKSVV